MRKAVAIVGTMDSKGEEHLFLKEVIEAKGYSTITIDVGTTGLSAFTPDFSASKLIGTGMTERTHMIRAVIDKARELILSLYSAGKIGAIISAGGGTGTFIGTSIMKGLPLGIPKVMVSTVASRDMSQTIGTKDITIMHSVVDLLGLNSLSRLILRRAAGAVCGMMTVSRDEGEVFSRVALSLFGFITQAAENAKAALEENGYEVIPFHANGTGGMAMEEMMGEAFFDGVLDLATHELVDAMFDGYCGGIGPQRLQTPEGVDTPRLVIPGGLDSAVLEFDHSSIPKEYKDRKIFFYDFRSAIRLTANESISVARTVANKLNRSHNPTKILIPLKGWSEADREGDALFDPKSTQAFLATLEECLRSDIEVLKVDHHINDQEFAGKAVDMLIGMITKND